MTPLSAYTDCRTDGGDDCAAGCKGMRARYGLRDGRPRRDGNEYGDN